MRKMHNALLLTVYLLDQKRIHAKAMMFVARFHLFLGAVVEVHPPFPRSLLLGHYSLVELAKNPLHQVITRSNLYIPGSDSSRTPSNKTFIRRGPITDNNVSRQGIWDRIGSIFSC